MSSVTNVYLHVIDDVIKNVRSEFQSEGVDDSVLQELQQLWELKLMQSGAVPSNLHEASFPPGTGKGAPLVGHDLNAPPPEQERITLLELPKSLEGLPKPFMPDPWERKPGAVLQPLADKKRKRDGEQSSQLPAAPAASLLAQPASATHLSPAPPSVTATFISSSATTPATTAPSSSSFPPAPAAAAAAPPPAGAAVEGGEAKKKGESAGDQGGQDNEEEEEDYNAPDQPSGAGAKAEAEKGTASDKERDDETLGEEDDDEDDLAGVDDNEDEKNETKHIVFATFDRVTRSKNRWKCVLRDGVMNLNGRDMLFFKGTGEFEF